jgi:hypothetical protein
VVRRYANVFQHILQRVRLADDELFKTLPCHWAAHFLVYFRCIAHLLLEVGKLLLGGFVLFDGAENSFGSAMIMTV